MNCVVLLLALATYVVIALALLLFGCDNCLRFHQPKRMRGLLQIILSLLMAGVLYNGPKLLFFADWGRLPASRENFGRLDKGITKERVIELLGKPFVKHDDDRYWYYYFAVMDDIVMIEFDDNDRLVRIADV
jgi:hypothetical protein